MPTEDPESFEALAEMLDLLVEPRVLLEFRQSERDTPGGASIKLTKEQARAC